MTECLSETSSSVKISVLHMALGSVIIFPSLKKNNHISFTFSDIFPARMNSCITMVAEYLFSTNQIIFKKYKIKKIVFKKY